MAMTKDFFAGLNKLPTTKKKKIFEHLKLVEDFAEALPSENAEIKYTISADTLEIKVING